MNAPIPDIRGIASMLDQPFAVTGFRDQYATVKHEEVWTLRSLHGRVLTITAGHKSKLPWLKLARFGDVRTPIIDHPDGRKTGGSLRHDANVLCVSGIEADYDGNVETFEFACETLTKQGIAALVYTSPSHTEDSQRWRVLCPLSAEMPPECRAKLLGRLNGLFRGIFSGESWTLSQGYFYGSVSHNPSHRAELIDGTPIDLHDDLDAIWTGKPNTIIEPGSKALAGGRLDKQAMLDAIMDAVNFHQATVRLAGHFAARETPYFEARKEITDAMESIPEADRDGRWRMRFDDIDRTMLAIYGKEAVKLDAKGGGTKPDTGPWGAPVDFLADDTSAAPVLAEQHIPAALWPFVKDAAARMGVDPTCVALAALVSCASVISDEWSVQPKRFDHTWTENARLWGAIVGDPSILKTPVISAATKPIDRLETESRERHAAAMVKWKAEADIAKLDKIPPPPKPKMDRFMVEGTTIEALSEVLRDDEEARFVVPCRKVLSRHDEMSEFFGGLDRYKAGGNGSSDRGAYLRLFNGGRFTVDRIGRGSFAVRAWSACFLGGVQPAPIQRIARDAADDGLLQRFIYAVPDKQQQGVDRNPDQAALARYAALFPALVAFRPVLAADDDHARPIVSHADAHQLREDIDALAAAMAAMPDTSSRLKAAFGKWPGLFARLCLTFHMITVADHRARGQTAPFVQVITAETAAQVAAFIREIVLPHLLRAEAVMFSTDQTGHARWVAGFILAHGLTRIATRDVTRAYRLLRAPEAKRDLEAVMASLVAVGWLEPEEPQNPAKPVSSWLVNPAVHTAFARRAEAEAERRAKAKEQIAITAAIVRAKRAA